MMLLVQHRHLRLRQRLHRWRRWTIEPRPVTHRRILSPKTGL